MSRVDILDHQIRMGLQDEGGRNVTRDEVWAAIADAQYKIVTETLILKGYQKITLVPAQDRYPIEEEVYKLKGFVEPTTWTYRLVVIENVEDWAEKKRATTDSTQPLYALVWSKMLHLWPAPTAADALEIFTFRLPSETITAGGDPEIPQVWDLALRYHAIASLLRVGPQADRYMGLFEFEMKRQAPREQRENAGAIRKRQHGSDDLNF